MSVHPRISVNSLSSLFQTLPDDIAIWRASVAIDKVNARAAVEHRLTVLSTHMMVVIGVDETAAALV